MDKLLFRFAKSNDLKRVIYITKLAYKKPYKENTLMTGVHEAKDIFDQFDKNKFKIIVATINNKIIGAIRFKEENKKIYFYKLSVLKSYRKKGVGATLVSKVEGEAKKKMYKKIILDCAQEKLLPEYYLKLGYKIDKIKKHLDHHDVFMSKKII